MAIDDPTSEPATFARVRTTQAFLRVVFSGGRPRTLDLAVAPSLEVGRATSTTPPQLKEDPSLSRHHATLVRQGDALEVKNHSQHGVFHNGARVDGVAVATDGDVLRFGDTFAVVRFIDEELVDAAVPSVVGRAPAICRLRHLVTIIGRTPARALLLGETGTGKEVFARALHASSGREGPFVAVNCAAIPEGLAESQLFGHKQGAFTGAVRDHPGFFAQARGGTLFLDELGELPLGLQAKLLRALDEGVVLPVGATAPLPVDVRVLTATNRDLVAFVQQGGFRGDLYARIAEITLRLPPLSARREDILPLLETVLPNKPLSASLVSALLLAPWTFNVRELLKVGTELGVKGATHAVLELDLLDGRLDFEAVPKTLPPTRPAHTMSTLTTPTAPPAAPLQPPPSKDELEALLKKHFGRVADVARATGRSRTQVYRWLEEMGLSPDSYRR